MAAAVEMSWERMKGKVRWFNATKGTGFVTPDGGNEYLFFHESSLKSGGSHGLKVDDSVEFEVRADRYGRLRAFDITCPCSDELENGMFVASVLGSSDAPVVFDEMPLKSEVVGRHLFGDIPVRESVVEIHCKDVIWDYEIPHGRDYGLLQQVGDMRSTDEEVVKWDDELQHDNSSHDGLLNLLAGCVDYKIDEETKPIDNPGIHEESAHGTQFLDSVVWDKDAQERDKELRLHCHSHVNLLEQFPNSRECFSDEESKLVAKTVNTNIFTQLAQHGEYQFLVSSMFFASTGESFYADMVLEKHFVNPLLSRLADVMGSQVSMQLKVAEAGQGLNSVNQFGGNLMGPQMLRSKVKQVFRKMPPWKKCALRSGRYTTKVDYLMLCQAPSWVCGGFSLWSKVSDKALGFVVFAGLMDIWCKRPHICFRQWDPGIFGYGCCLRLSTPAENFNEQKAQLAVEFVDAEVLTHVGSSPLFLELGIDSADRMAIELCNLDHTDGTGRTPPPQISDKHCRADDQQLVYFST